MFKLPKIIFTWIATVIIMFAVCSPITGSLAGILFISQNVNSLITVLLGVLCGIIIAFYTPIINDYFKHILHLLTK